MTFLRAHSDSCSQQPVPLGIFSNPAVPHAQGCFEHIGHAIDSYTWGISWFGFAILMWTVRGGEPMGWGDVGVGLERPSPDCLFIQLPVMLMAMCFYTTL